MSAANAILMSRLFRRSNRRILCVAALIGAVVATLGACGPNGFVPGKSFAPGRTDKVETDPLEPGRGESARAQEESAKAKPVDSSTRSEEDELIKALFRESTSSGDTQSPTPSPTPTIQFPEPSEDEIETPSAEPDVKSEPTQKPQVPTLPEAEGEPTSRPDTRVEPRLPRPSPKPSPAPQQPNRPAPKQPEHRPSPPAVKIKGFWDGRAADGSKWTRYAAASLARHGQSLLKVVPVDVNRYCPTYPALNQDGRKEFWIKLISAIAAAESSFNPWAEFSEKMRDRSGKTVVSRGLLQLSQESSQAYGCKFENEQQIHYPHLNIDCGVKILVRWINEDGAIGAQATDGGWLGAARYWSTFRDTNPRSEVIKKLMRQSALCQN